MHFLIWETLSFNLMYVAACYPVGTTISKTSSLFTALLKHYTSRKDNLYCHLSSKDGLCCLCCFTHLLPVKLSGLYIKRISFRKYTQTKKKRPIFMVLYLSIQLRCCNKNRTKMLIKRPTHKKWK